MRKVIVSNLVSLDGFFEGPGDELDWFVTDESFFEYAREMLNETGTILFGRKTYQMMVAYWPSSTDNDPVITHKMNSLPKIVFSRTLASVDWENATLEKGPLEEAIRKLKQGDGKDLVLLGSGSIVSALLQKGLIDEYRLIVNPVVLGSGHPMFKGIPAMVKLKLIKTRVFDSGNVMLYYEPLN